MSIDEQIKNAEIELLRLKALKEQKWKEFKPFDEICWEADYDHVVENYAKLDIEDLYEYRLETVCPIIFKR